MSEPRNVYSIDFLRAIGRQMQQSSVSSRHVDKVMRHDRMPIGTRLSSDTRNKTENNSNVHGNHNWHDEDDDDSQLQFAFDKE